MLTPEETSDNDARWKAIGKRMDGFERKLQINTESTNRVEANTAELVDILNSWKGAMKVLSFLSKPITWFAALGASIVAIITAWPKK